MAERTSETVNKEIAGLKTKTFVKCVVFDGETDLVMREVELGDSSIRDFILRHPDYDWFEKYQVSEGIVQIDYLSVNFKSESYHRTRVFPNGVVFALEELSSSDSNSRLVDWMKDNGVDRVVRTEHGRYHEFKHGDIALEIKAPVK